jgi:hypothetical protein
MLPGLSLFFSLEQAAGFAEVIMIIHPADRPVVKWAVDNGFIYGYRREHGLPDPSLLVQLGVSNAFFKEGRLVHLRADVDGSNLDQLMFELTSLFGICAAARGYLMQEVFLSVQERACLDEPPDQAG